MIKFIKCDDRVLKKLPSIMELLYSIYGEEVVSVYAVCDKDEVCFIVIGKLINLYIDKKGYRGFTVDYNNNLLYYKSNEYDVYFDDAISFKDSKGFIYSLSFNKLDYEEDGYTGEILFNQYDVINDCFCQTVYHQMYNVIEGKAPIYRYHAEEPYHVYIEDNRSKKKLKYGLVHPSIHSYNLYTFDRDTFNYDRMLIHDYGLTKFLSSNKYMLERSDKIQKYIKCRFRFGDKFYDGWPFPSVYSKKEVLDMVKERGFMVGVPSRMIEIYNGYDSDIYDISRIMKEFDKIKHDNDYEIELTLKLDKNN